MSRIGKQPVPVPDQVKVSIRGSVVGVEGPLGELEMRLPSGISAKLGDEGKRVVVSRASEAKRHRSLHGLNRTLIANMILGVSQGFKKELELVGIGYNASLQGKQLVLSLGLANEIKLSVPEGVKVEVSQATNPARLSVTGCDKQQVGEFAARIRAVYPPEPYQGKGFRYVGEEVRRKAGKAFVGTGA